MTTLDDYSGKYQTIEMERAAGVLEISFHTEGGPLQWGSLPHQEFGEAFADIGNDPENEVVIMTGTGDTFSGPVASPGARPSWAPNAWMRETLYHGQLLQTNLLNIGVPMISAINGPAWRHSELPLLCDIVLCTQDTAFQDSGHFRNGLVPGDGMHIIYPLLLGMNRGRYFLLTGQTIDAQEAKEMGLVNEVLTRDRLLPRARELAQQIMLQPQIVRRATRELLTAPIKRHFQDMLGYGLAMEGLGVGQSWGERP